MYSAALKLCKCGPLLASITFYCSTTLVLLVSAGGFCAAFNSKNHW